MNESHLSPAYEEGVEQFLQFASERSRPDENGKFFCPCIYCVIDMQNGSQSRQESFQQAHAPMFDTLQTDSKKPLYPGCKNSLMLLLVVLGMVNVKAIYRWSDKIFSSLLQVLHDMLLE